MITTRSGLRVLAICTSLATLGGAFAQAPATQRNDNGAFFLEHDALTPPLLFREIWQQPPHTGELTDENRRITPQALTNANLTLQLYGSEDRKSTRLNSSH